MGKRKKKSKQDARGYSTTVIVPKTNQPIAQEKTQDKQASTKNNDEATGSVRLRASPREPISPSPKIISKSQDFSDTTVSKRFFKRIENLYDKLIECKFSEDQVRKVIEGLVSSAPQAKLQGGIFSMENALDWLCLNLTAEELPSRFTDEESRDKAEKPSNISVDVSTRQSNIENYGEKKEKRKDCILDLLPCTGGSKEKPVEKDNVDKSWIIGQYQYVDEDDKVEIEDKAPTQKQDIERLQERVEQKSAEELRFEKLQREIEEIRSHLNDEASMYMMSKHDIKSMKTNLRQLEGKAKKLQGKIASPRKQRENQAKKVTEELEEFKENSSQNGAMEDENCEGFGVGLFDTETLESEIPLLGIESCDSTSSPNQNLQIFNNEKVTNPIRLSSSNPSIPSDWTGSTPKKQLEEWCKKQKLDRPTFSRMGHSGCRVKVKTKKSIVLLEQVGPFYNYSDAQQYVSTQALYELNDGLPLYRMFPPTFQELWISWLNLEKSKKTNKDRESRLTKDKKVQELINLIPKKLRVGGENTDQDKGISSFTTEASDTLDQPSNEHDIGLMIRRKDYQNVQADQNQLALNLKTNFLRKVNTPQYKEIKVSREKLPIHDYREELLNCIANNKVTVLCAETGAGKSTQAPQFMLEDALSAGIGDKVSIICTQPRRLSAISLADRVAEEMCVKLGDLVGYQIRGESVKSHKTRLLFCTTGVILRRLQDDPELKSVTTIVVDEVHERSWQIDFLLIVLRRLISTARPDLKVVLVSAHDLFLATLEYHLTIFKMSATLDATLFTSFFGGAPLINVPGRTFPVSNYFLEDLLDATDHTIEEYSICARRKRDHLNTESVWVTKPGGEKRREILELESMTDVSEVSGLYSSYKMSTQRSMDRVDEKVLNYELIEDVISLLCRHDNDMLLFPSSEIPTHGAILVFLPGMAEIRNLTNRLNGNRLFGDKNKFKIIPLHSSLSSQDQRRAFAKVPKSCRKILLSTNIAETSVTVPDVVCVIDSGMERTVQQDKRYATSRLILDWCSKASIKQRAGRAGRVREGICCRLFSSRTPELFMKDQSTPELQRVPLEEVCLTILAGNLSNNCTAFLMQAPQPPPFDSIILALNLLKEVGAIDMVGERESLTTMGKHISKLPVHVRLAKMLILASIFKCLDPILTVVSALACKTPFVSTMINSSAHTTAVHAKFKHHFSDFMSYVNLWRDFSSNVSSDRGRSFCKKNYISWAVMMDILDLRRQNLELLYQIGFIDNVPEKDIALSTFNQNGKNDAILHSIICAGLFPNVAHVENKLLDSPFNLWHKKEELFFHSSSVNHNKKKLPSRWIMFHEKFATGRTTVSTTSPIFPSSMLFFGGEIQIKHLDRKVVIDEWVELEMAAQTAVLCRDLRQRLDNVLLNFYENTNNDSREKVVSEVVQLISQKQGHLWSRI